MAVIILWGFAITCIEKDDAAADFKKGKAWVAQNFTWLYIGAAPYPAPAPRPGPHAPSRARPDTCRHSERLVPLPDLPRLLPLRGDRGGSEWGPGCR